MALDLTNAAQLSRFIDETRAVILKLHELQAAANQYNEIDASNDAGTVLGAQGATFPQGFNLTPARLNDARYAMNAVIKPALDTAAATAAASLNRFLYDIGVIVGTG